MAQSAGHSPKHLFSSFNHSTTNARVVCALSHYSIAICIESLLLHLMPASSSLAYKPPLTHCAWAGLGMWQGWITLVCHGAFLPHGYVQNAQSADLASLQHIVSMILSIVLILTPRIGFTLLTIEMNGGSSAELSSPKLRREAAVQLQFQPHLQLCLNLCCLLHHCHNANAVPPHDCSQPCKHDLYQMQAPCLIHKHRKQRPQPCFKGSNRHYTSQILKC